MEPVAVYVLLNTGDREVLIGSCVTSRHCSKYSVELVEKWPCPRHISRYTDILMEKAEENHEKCE